MSAPYVIASTVSLAYLAVCLSRSRPNRRGAPLPPGPKGLPIIGNALDWPDGEKEAPCLVLNRMADTYGDIIYFHIFGTSIIVLSSPKYTTELLVRKWRVYSDRPELTLAGKLVGWENDGSMQQHGPVWTQMRKLFSSWMGNSTKVAEFEDLIRSKVLEFVEKIRTKKYNRHEEWTEYCADFAAGVIINLVYGKEPTRPENMQMADDVKQCMTQFGEMLAPAGYLVDTFPILRFIPSWFPGAEWKKRVPLYRQTLHDLVHKPFETLKGELASGQAVPNSFLARELSNKPDVAGEEEYVLKWAASTVNSGGIDTTRTTLETFILALCLQPTFRLAAQTEIDRVLGKGAIPTLADRPSLPYLEAFYKEILRFYGGNALGLGFPHVAHEDDVHDGMFIPKGTIVFANVWRFFHDPSIYADPLAFRPERFLGESPEIDPKTWTFGFGRRSCPGEHLANATMWLSWTTLLSLLDIRSPEDTQEKEKGMKKTEGRFTTDKSIGLPDAFDFVAVSRS